MEEILSLSKDGKNYARDGLPERKLLNLLQKDETVHMKDLGAKSFIWTVSSF